MLQFQLNENEDGQDWLRQQVRQYNVDRSSFHATKRSEGTQAFTLLANRDDHRIGGISGEVYWGWLHIEWFFVVEEERGSGLGATLLNRLEEWAREAGVQRIRVETFSFQALPFYERHGFVEVGRIDDYPPGMSYHLLVKQVDL
ncbi:GNAT family N-acetyltransferase [Exiguobacterium sp. BMC-KP]|uniref:GNAT family N-acetyltransferase n=1 Tax=Exiguobacterium sp. BMC-KP TaxID=1684312 RepID=UPI0006AA191A|nr:GNAT family N-acetyltransferase [Exiguobacterium sp. BMC-KP]